MNKYNNKKIFYDGIQFDSKREYERYKVLKTLHCSGRIRGLIVHPVFLLQPAFQYNGKMERSINYEADFTYFDNDLNKTVIEDSKGFRTEVYKLKRKMFLKQLAKDTLFMET